MPHSSRGTLCKTCMSSTGCLVRGWNLTFWNVVRGGV